MSSSFREDGSQPVSLVFDLDGCGLKNMDMEFIQYMIGVFRDYSPFSLNYILVYEMPWVLNGDSMDLAQLLIVCQLIYLMIPFQLLGR